MATDGNGEKGKIIKGIGGFYYVDTGNDIIECRARGRFRYEGVTPLVGDIVTIEDAYVIDIAPRKNSLIRPKVANVDKAFITFAAAKPKINFEILDKFLILTAAAKVQAVICINKIDLAKGSTLSDIKTFYNKSGAEIIEVSAEENIGIDRIRAELTGVTSVFAGPSGVGKSSIINLVVPELNLKTGAISKKISRGKHTTREAVLVSLGNNSYVVDTPGFTSLSLDHIAADKLYEYFAEFTDYVKHCKYNSCAHYNEQTEDCAVKMQVGKDIHPNRYNCYVRIYKELKNLEEMKYD